MKLVGTALALLAALSVAGCAAGSSTGEFEPHTANTLTVDHRAAADPGVLGGAGRQADRRRRVRAGQGAREAARRRQGRRQDRGLLEDRRRRPRRCRRRARADHADRRAPRGARLHLAVPGGGADAAREGRPRGRRRADGAGAALGGRREHHVRRHRRHGHPARRAAGPDRGPRGGGPHGRRRGGRRGDVRPAGGRRDRRAGAGPLDGGAAQRHRADRRRAAEGLAQHRRRSAPRCGR